MIDRRAAGLVIAGERADLSSSVDLPVPFSPTMMVIARSKLSVKLSFRNGRQNGYAARSAMPAGSRQSRPR
jgi:hypothetical protein